MSAILGITIGVKDRSKYCLPNTANGDLFFLMLMHLVGISGTAGAFFNLHTNLPVGTKLISLVWLVGYFFIWAWNVRNDGGMLSTGSKILEHFAQEHFLEVSNSPDNPILCLKYRCLGSCFTILEASISEELKLSWYPGQASTILGEDVDDWLVCLEIQSPNVVTIHRRRASFLNKTSLFLAAGLTKRRAEGIAEELKDHLEERALPVSLKPSKITFDL